MFAPTQVEETGQAHATRLSLTHTDCSVVQAGRAQNGAKLVAIATSGGVTFLDDRGRISGGTIAAPTRPNFLTPSLSPAHGCLEALDRLCDSVLKISYPPEWLTHTSSSIPSNERSQGTPVPAIPKWEVKMNRRNFLKTAAIATTASTIAAPAIAQPTPELHWRMALSWPKSLDTLFGACEQFAKRVAELTDNKFQIQLFAAGEIVPGLQVLDAVQNGTVEAGNTGGYYYWGKDPSFAFSTAVPFGLNTRQAEAWFYHGGGHELLNELYAQYNC